MFILHLGQRFQPEGSIIGFLFLLIYIYIYIYIYHILVKNDLNLHIHNRTKKKKNAELRDKIYSSFLTHF